MPNKLTIAWDVDDVLNDLMRCWFEEFKISSPEHWDISYEDILKNPPHEVLNIGFQDYLDSLDKFRLSDKAYDMIPNREILSWFKENGHKYRHIALTATPVHTAPVSAYWVTTHFGKWINSFNFVPSKREGRTNYVHDNNKKEFLSWLGKVDFLIDDNEEHINGADSIGINGLLISRPWNRGGMSIEEALNCLFTERIIGRGKF